MRRAYLVLLVVIISTNLNGQWSSNIYWSDSTFTIYYGTVSMNYFVDHDMLYLETIATWSVEIDTTGLSIASLVVCEDPNNEGLLGLLWDCETEQDNTYLYRGINEIFLRNIQKVNKKSILCCWSLSLL